MDIDPEKLSAALAYEDEGAILERAERKTQGYLYLAVYILIVVISVRVIVNKPVAIEYGNGYAVPASTTERIKPEIALPVEKHGFIMPK